MALDEEEGGRLDAVGLGPLHEPCLARDLLVPLAPEAFRGPLVPADSLLLADAFPDLDEVLRQQAEVGEDRLFHVVLWAAGNIHHHLSHLLQGSMGGPWFIAGARAVVPPATKVVSLLDFVVDLQIVRLEVIGGGHPVNPFRNRVDFPHPVEALAEAAAITAIAHACDLRPSEAKPGVDDAEDRALHAPAPAAQRRA